MSLEHVLPVETAAAGVAAQAVGAGDVAQAMPLHGHGVGKGLLTDGAHPVREKELTSHFLGSDSLEQESLCDKRSRLKEVKSGGGEVKSGVG